MQFGYFVVSGVCTVCVCVCGFWFSLPECALSCMFVVVRVMCSWLYGRCVCSWELCVVSDVLWVFCGCDCDLCEVVGERLWVCVCFSDVLCGVLRVIVRFALCCL